MDGNLLLEVLTPMRKVLSAQVSECAFPTEERGYYGILPGHTPLLTPVGDGLITFVQKGKKGILTVFGGFAEVSPDKVTILASESESPEAFDVTVLEGLRQNALNAIKEAKDPGSLAAAQKELDATNIRLQATDISDN